MSMPPRFPDRPSTRWLPNHPATRARTTCRPHARPARRSTRRFPGRPRRLLRRRQQRARGPCRARAAGAGLCVDRLRPRRAATRLRLCRPGHGRQAHPRRRRPPPPALPQPLPQAGGGMVGRPAALTLLPATGEITEWPAPRISSSPACGGGRVGASGRAARPRPTTSRDPPPTPPASGRGDDGASGASTPPPPLAGEAGRGPAAGQPGKARRVEGPSPAPPAGGRGDGGAGGASIVPPGRWRGGRHPKSSSPACGGGRVGAGGRKMTMAGRLSGQTIRRRTMQSGRRY